MAKFNVNIKPTISEFVGIVITMRFLDHNPPHFHARYQNCKVLVEIENGVVRGDNGSPDKLGGIRY